MDSIENGQSLLAVLIYTSYDVVSITEVILMLLVLAFPATE